MHGGPWLRMAPDLRTLFNPGAFTHSVVRAPRDAEETSLDPPEQIPQLVLRVLPALLASAYSAASAVFGNIPHTRRLALLDSLGEGPRAALERYLSQTGVIEARWLVIRVLGDFRRISKG